MKKFISLALVLALMTASTVSFAFTDVDKSHWADEYITKLTSDGIINGYEDGSFRPEGLVTKAELAKLIAKSFNPEGKGGNFSDISSHWANKYITQCAKLFYAPSSKFLPDLPATRAEVAYALANVLSLEASEDVTFSDSDTVADEMKNEVSAMVGAGLMNGYEDGTIRGDGFVTRAESAALIVRAKEYKAPEAEKPEEKPEAPSDKDHIYTLYPLKDLLLVKSVTTSVDADGDEVCKITYSVAGDEEKTYTSKVKKDADITVVGTKLSLDALAPGDVFMIDTAFLGYISTIIVVSSFGEATPPISIPSVLTHGAGGKYEFWAGTVLSYEAKTNTVVLDVFDGTTTLEVIAKKTTPVSVFMQNGSKHRWESDSFNAIDEGSFVLVRFEDDTVTEIIVKN